MMTPEIPIHQATGEAGSGRVYLIPSFLHEHTPHVIPPYVRDILRSLRHFFVENERTARRFIKEVIPDMPIAALHLYPMNQHEMPDLSLAKKLWKQGIHIGIISEAGYPCIADPGQVVVLAAHEAGVPVLPLVGPSSILMALGASGMNGQNFQFTGYLPVKQPARIQALRELEKRSRQLGQTQIFIETPYRNHSLFNDILQCCQDQTWLCIAAEITGPEEFIQTKRISDWKKQLPALHKKPAIFLLSAG